MVEHDMVHWAVSREDLAALENTRGQRGVDAILRDLGFRLDKDPAGNYIHAIERESYTQKNWIKMVEFYQKVDDA